MAENGKKQENGNGEFDNLGYVKKLGYYYLGNVSRTFALTIPILRLFKGEYEYDKSELTMLFYLIPRGMDAIEDSNLSHDKKIKYLPDFTVFLKKGDEKDAPPIAEQWHKFTNDLLSERNPKNSNELAILNPKEVDMLRDFAILWRSFYKMDPELKSIAVRWLEEMAEGMLVYDHPEELNNFSKLDDYCLHVAGTVGRLLTEVVRRFDKYPDSGKPIYLSRDAAQKFGLFLQYVNVCRDIGDDQRKLGKIWVPTELYSELYQEQLVGPALMGGNALGKKLKELSKDFIESTENNVRKVRLNALEKMLARTDEHRKSSLEYVSSIPEILSGYRNFCLLNWIMATENLKEMRKDALAESANGQIENYNLTSEEEKMLDALREAKDEKSRMEKQIGIDNYFAQRGIRHVYFVNEGVFHDEGGVKIGSLASREKLKSQLKEAIKDGMPKEKIEAIEAKLNETECEIRRGIPLIENMIHHVCYSPNCTKDWIEEYSANPYRYSFSLHYPFIQNAESKSNEFYKKISVLFPKEKPKRGSNDAD